jgi:MFS family permease
MRDAFVTDQLPSASPWRALRHRNFALFATGHGLSLCGSWMQSLAQAWLVYRLTESPLLLGVTEFLARAPILFLSLAAGLVADRVPRYQLMVLTQILLLLQAATLAALTLTGLVTVPWILALALLMGLISALEIPIRQTFMTDLVPPQDIPSAIGLNSSMFNAARIVGPSLAGVLVVTVGEGPCFLINALSYLVVLGSLKAMRIAPLPPHPPGNAASQLREGLMYARTTPHVRAVLAAVAAVSIAAMPYATLLPVFAGEVLRVGPAGLGWLMAATGVGALAGALKLARRPSVTGLASSICRAVTLFGGSLLLFAASRSLWLSILALAAIGFAMVGTLAASNTLLQSLAPNGMRGRVVSLYTTASLGFTVFGSLLGGVAGTSLGAPLTVALGGLVTLSAAAGLRRALPGLRRHAELARFPVP